MVELYMFIVTSTVSTGQTEQPSRWKTSRAVLWETKLQVEVIIAAAIVPLTDYRFFILLQVKLLLSLLLRRELILVGLAVLQDALKVVRHALVSGFAAVLDEKIRLLSFPTEWCLKLGPLEADRHAASWGTLIDDFTVVEDLFGLTVMALLGFGSMFFRGSCFFELKDGL